MPDPDKKIRAKPAAELSIAALAGIPLVQPGDDIASLILSALAASGLSLQRGDILVVAQKIVSKAENRFADLGGVTPSERAAALAIEVDKDPRLVELILRESTEVVRHRKGVLVVAHRSGVVLANAGIDTSNVAGTDQRALLLPEDCNRSCRDIRVRLAQRTGIEAGVLIIDSLGRAWRNGTVGVALGAAGIPALLDLRGKPDLFGRELRSTEVGIADEIAAAASMLMGQASEGTPVVLLRGLDLPDSHGSADDLIRAREFDLFPVSLTMAEPRFTLALAGGVGGGKFARGLAAALPPERLAIAVNTADDFVHLGLHVSPDVNSVLYALADLNDLERGWGLAGETWNFMAAMERLGGETWFKLGDRDLATHIFRTQALAAGQSLSDVTVSLARRLGVAHTVLPMTDQCVRSIVDTDEGALDFQDYFVRRQCQPKFLGVRFDGMADAKPSAAFHDALDRAVAIIITPSNPFVSIDPILALAGIRDNLRRRGRPIVAVSPIVGGKAIKGPLAKMMSERDVEPSALGVARHYGDLVGGWVIDEADRALAPAIAALGCRVKVCNTIMQTLDDKRRLAQDMLQLASEMAGQAVG